MSLQFLLDFATPEAHDAPVYALAATHEVVWSGAADGSVRSWDAVSGASLGAVRSPHKAAVTALSVSPALGLVLSSSMDGSVALWSIRDFAARQRLVPPPAPDADPLPPPDFSQQAPLECLAFVASIAQLPFPSESKHFPIDSYVAALHPTQPLVATTGNTATGAIYRLSPSFIGSAQCEGPRGTEVDDLLEPLYRFRASGVLRTTNTDPTPAAKGPLAAVGKHGWGMTISFSPDGDLVGLGSSSGQVVVYAVKDGATVASFSNHSAPVRSIAWSLLPSAESLLGTTQSDAVRLDHLLIGAEDTTITVHDALDLLERAHEASDNTIAILQGHGKMVSALSARQDGRIIASASTDGTAKLWDLAASPKTVVCTSFEEYPLWCIEWLPEPPTETEAAVLSGAASGSGPVSRRFLVAGDEGRVKWYRSAGAAAVRDI